VDVITSNRIYDEIAMTIGMRLSDLGQKLDAEQTDVLASEVERDAGMDGICALGRLALDTDDVDSIDRAIEAQQDRIRSIISLHSPEDPVFVARQRNDLTDAKLRHRLLKAYRRNDRDGMLSCYEAIMVIHANRR